MKTISNEVRRSYLLPGISDNEMHRRLRDETKAGHLLRDVIKETMIINLEELAKRRVASKLCELTPDWLEFHTLVMQDDVLFTVYEVIREEIMDDHLEAQAKFDIAGQHLRSMEESLELHPYQMA